MSRTSRVDALFEKIAIERGLLDPTQLQMARLIQARTDPSRKLGAVLLEQGYLTRRQTEMVLEEIGRRLKADKKEAAGKSRERPTAAVPKIRVARATAPLASADVGTPNAETRSEKAESGGSRPLRDPSSEIHAEDTSASPTRAFGPYVILEEIARGGMGIVYKARQSRPNRVVALKILREGERANDEQVQRFRREVQSAARLKHPNIIAVHEAGEIDGNHYFTMDFIEGEDLDRRMTREGVVDLDTALTLIRQVAEAIHYAHAHGVIHRDLKPGNIILDRDGSPKITDFGLAKAEGDGTKLTRSDQSLGTPTYMSPEQAQGRANHVDARTDVYSLGVILYRLTTGMLPFVGDTSMELFQKLIHDDPSSPRSLNPRIPREVETIILRAIEKDPNRRYPTADALAQDIARYQAGEPILARPVGRIQRLARKAAKHRAILIPGVAAFAIGLALVAIFVAPEPTDGEATDEDRRLLAAEEALAAAGHQIELGSTEQARAYLEDVAAAEFSHPSGTSLVARAHALLARLDVEENLPAAALAHLDRALEIDPSAIEIVVHRAALRLQLGRVREALDDATTAIRSEPDRESALRIAADCHRALGEPENALPYLARQVALAPNNAETRIDRIECWLAVAQSRAEDFRLPGEVKDDLAQVRTLLPRFDPRGPYLEGRLAEEESDIEAATQHYTESLAKLATFTPAYYQRGILHLTRTFEFRKALDDLHQAAELVRGSANPEGPRSVTALFREPFPDLGMHLARAHLHHGDPEEAIRILGEALAAGREPKGGGDDGRGRPAICLELGRSFSSAGRLEEARSAYLGGLEDQPLDRNLRLALASLLARDGKFEESLVEYDRALTSRGSAADIRDWEIEVPRCGVLLDLGRAQEVLPDLDVARKALPDDALACELAARACLATKGREAASELYARHAQIAADRTGRVRAVRDLALAFQKRQEMRKALSLLRLAVEYAPSDPEIEIALARILVRELDFARGRAILATLERRFPLLADVYVAQADVAAETQDFAESVLRLDTALAIVPGDSNVRFRRAEILHADGRSHEALADLAICERTEGAKIRTHALRARVLRALGRESDALAEEMRAKRIRQDESPEVEKYLDEAEGYMKNGQLGRAIELLNLAEEKDPTHPDIYYERAKIRVELFKEKSDFGEFSRALLDYARSLELDPSRAEQFLARAREVAFYINLDNVLQELDTLMAHSGDRSSAHFARGFLLYMRATLSNPDPDLLEQAVLAYSTALRINADNVIALVLRGMALHRLDRFDEALADYRRAEAIQPDFGLVHYASACCHARMGQPEPALAHIERMLSTGPDPDLCSRLKVESELAGLREDPRMQDLLAKYCPGGG